MGGLTFWVWADEMAYPPMRWFNNRFYPASPSNQVLDILKQRLPELQATSTIQLTGRATVYPEQFEADAQASSATWEASLELQLAHSTVNAVPHVQCFYVSGPQIPIGPVGGPLHSESTPISSPPSATPTNVPSTAPTRDPTEAPTSTAPTSTPTMAPTNPAVVTSAVVFEGLDPVAFNNDTAAQELLKTNLVSSLASITSTQQVSNVKANTYAARRSGSSTSVSFDLEIAPIAGEDSGHLKANLVSELTSAVTSDTLSTAIASNAPANSVWHSATVNEASSATVVSDPLFTYITTQAPTTAAPSNAPTSAPSRAPSQAPSVSPSNTPSLAPSGT